MATTESNSGKKITFYEKNVRACPICGERFKHEQLLTGGGRLIAGSLRRDLRRMYETTKKYGNVYPLLYAVVVCPRCLYAAFIEDFEAIEKEEQIENCSKDSKSRNNYVNKVFGYDIDFTVNRTLISGAAAYFLAINSYYYHDKSTFPTFKRALCSLRLSWVLEDLHKEMPNDNYDSLIPFFQYKAKEFYNASVEIMNNGNEHFENIRSYGPDIDKNYGFEGMLYMAALLDSTFSFFIENPETRAKELVLAKRKISKIFGSGKSSRSKPSALLDLIKDLHTEINDNLEKLSEQTGIVFK